MGEVLKQREMRTYWMVCEARLDGQWCHRGWLLETQEEGYRKLRWLRRWHPNAFLVSMLMTQCDSESPQPSLPTQPPEPQPTGRPPLRLV